MSVIGILGTGDMGSAVGRALIASGHQIITDLSGRSDYSRALALAAGVEDVGSLCQLVVKSNLFLSIVPPANALALAEMVMPVIASKNPKLVYADCNAVAPSTSLQIAKLADSLSLRYQDAGIVGAAPKAARVPVRIYTSGPYGQLMGELAGPLIQIKHLGTEIGKASALKMAYASLTKGTHTLRTAVALVSALTGVYDELMDELEFSQSAALDSMVQTIPRLPVDAARWTGEMREIAKTYRELGVTPGFHEAAEWIYQLMDKTPIAQETKTDRKSRDLEEVIQLLRDRL